MRITSIVAVAGAALSVASATACSAPSSHRPVTHDEGEGYLSATYASGGSSVYAPKARPYRASFGSFVLCNDRSDDDIEIESVEFNFGSPRPQAAKAFVRHVEPGELRGGAVPPRSLGPFVSSLGGPPDFSESYAGYEAAGTFADAAGATVQESCQSAARAGGAARNGTQFDSAFTNLVITLEVGEDGGIVKDFTVAYAVGGDKYALHVDSEMIGCGTAVKEQYVCPDDVL